MGKGAHREADVPLVRPHCGALRPSHDRTVRTGFAVGLSSPLLLGGPLGHPAEAWPGGAHLHSGFIGRAGHTANNPPPTYALIRVIAAHAPSQTCRGPPIRHTQVKQHPSVVKPMLQANAPECAGTRGAVGMSAPEACREVSFDRLHPTGCSLSPPLRFHPWQSCVGRGCWGLGPGVRTRRVHPREQGRPGT